MLAMLTIVSGTLSVVPPVVALEGGPHHRNSAPDPSFRPWSGTVSTTFEWSEVDELNMRWVLFERPQPPDKNISEPHWDCVGSESHSMTISGDGEKPFNAYQMPSLAEFTGEETCTGQYFWSTVEDPTTWFPCNTSASWNATYSVPSTPEQGELWIDYTDLAGGYWSFSGTIDTPSPVTYSVDDSCGWMTAGEAHAPYIAPSAVDSTSGETDETLTIGTRLTGIETLSDRTNSWDFIYTGEDSLTCPPQPDATGAVIARCYAPEIVFHEDEQHWPMSIDRFIQNSSLRWTHNRCSDEKVWKSPDPRRLGAKSAKPYQHATKGLRCKHRDDNWKTNDFTRPRTKRDGWGKGRSGLEKNEGFVLNLKDSKRHGTPSTHADPAQYSGSDIYYDYDKKNGWIRYFIMYGWSEAPGGTDDTDPGCCHEGEWEGFSIKLDQNKEPTRVFLNQHHGGMLVDWESMKKVDGTHPVIHSAEGAHASYPSVGAWFVSTFTGMDMTGDGRKWKTWDTHTKRLNVRTQPWWGFGGGWGDILGKQSIPHFGTNFVGPLGPSKYMRSSPWACGATTPCWPGGDQPPTWP
jgi:hypothetical protein